MILRKSEAKERPQRGTWYMYIHVIAFIYQIENVFLVLVHVTQVKVGRTRNAVETRAAGECFHSNFEFSQTFTSITITLWKQEKIIMFSIVFY